MTPQQAKEWIASSPATRSLLEELGLPANPQPGSLDEMEMVAIADATYECYMDGWMRTDNP